MHLGIIMDGNRRFAKKNILSTLTGHQSGFKKLLELVKLCPKYNISSLTVYALSTENFKSRSQEELINIINILKAGLYKYKEELIKNGVKVKFLGDLSIFDKELRGLMNELQDRSKENSDLILQICLNYGGRQDILQALNKVKHLDIITENDIDNALYTDINPDLIIRTGGDFRMSNFLTWQSTYSELYFTNTLWPEFTEEELSQCVAKFKSVERRFGK
jgi:undecaprenyl diphosphate synthase